MGSLLFTASIVAIAIGGALVGVGLYQVLADVERDLWRMSASVHNAASRVTVSDLARSVDGLAATVRSEFERSSRAPAPSAPPAPQSLVRMATSPTAFTPTAAPIPKASPIEVVLSWWNQGNYGPREIEGALAELRRRLPEFHIARAEMVRGLVGLTFSPSLPDHQATVILPDLSVSVGDVSPVFEAPHGTPSGAAIRRTLALASIETGFQREARHNLPGFGLRPGRVEPGESL